MKPCRPYLVVLCLALFLGSTPAWAEEINLTTDNTVATNQTLLTIDLDPGTVVEEYTISYTGDAVVDYDPATGALDLVSAVLEIPEDITMEIWLQGLLTTITGGALGMLLYRWIGNSKRFSNQG